MPSHKSTSFDSPGPTPLTQRLLWLFLAVLVLGTAVYFLGPRNDTGPFMPSPRPQPPQDITALADWISASESTYPDIKPGNAKGIVWAAAPGTRTKWSVVYVHGFSASRLETAPLAETVASQLGANLFYTRLSGHGRADGAAMGQATAQDWIADTLEAVAIGQTLGERVLLISCSTGSTLATWLGTSSDAARVSAHIFVSPNFGPKDKRSEIINAPWGQKIALWVQGPTRSVTPESALEANAWTPSYPTKALFPMMGLVKSVRESDLSLFQTPVLMMYSERDETVEPAETLAAFTRLGSARKSIETITYSKSKGQHVLAGAIKDPSAVAPMAGTMVRWVKSLPQEPG
jgi:alpha-beta hydrolase superfamily lysophospholipase